MSNYTTDSVGISPVDLRFPDRPQYTAQEFIAVRKCAIDAGANRTWRICNGAPTWTDVSLPHQIVLLSPREGLPTEYSVDGLFSLCREQGAETFNILNLVVGALINKHLNHPNDRRARGFLKLDDIIDVLSLRSWSPDDAANSRRMIYQAIRFIAAAWIQGQRTGMQRSRGEATTLSTDVDSQIWIVRDVVWTNPSGNPLVEPNIVSLMAWPKAHIPWYDRTIMVEIEICGGFTPLCAGRLAQYVPGADMVSKFHTGQTVNGTARSVIPKVKEIFRVSGPDPIVKQCPTRRELLEDTTGPGNSRLIDVAFSRNPKRALEYWHALLVLLTDPR